MARLKIKIFLAIFAALLTAAHIVLWVAISTKGPIYLQNYLSRRMGWNVETDSVKFSLLSQGVKIKNLRISDPARPEARPLFTAKRVMLRLNLFALVAGRLTVRKLTLLSPCVNLSRDAAGHWMMPALPRATEPQTPRASAPGQNNPASAPFSRIRNPFRFALHFYRFDVRKGELLLGDDMSSPPFWVRLKNIQAKGQFATPTLFRLSLDGIVESKEAGALHLQGNIAFPPGSAWQASMDLSVDNVDITLLSPYYQHRSPAAITGGKISLHSRLQCGPDILKDSRQTITVKDLKIHSWSEDFLDKSMMGIPNREVADYIDRNAERIQFDFSVSGPLDEIASLTVPDAWQSLGISAVQQWFHKENAQ